MCGIGGILSWRSPPDSMVIQTMIKSLAHRGPDAEGFWAKGPISLGHRRLSIQDTSVTADQPMQDPSGRYVIAFNGEIYNFQRVRTLLLQQGFTFRTHSDTEVILTAWLHWGIEAIHHLEGMFAFALWDNHQQELYIVRDRFGEKPLYYFTSPDHGVVFASELKALRKHPQCPYSLNPRAISQFLSLNYILTSDCIFQGIHKLPPAHYMVCKQGIPPSIQPYWSLAKVFHEPKWTFSEQECIESFQELLLSTVGDCTVADVPLGAFLSGGIDSSAIVAAMCQKQEESRVKAFTIGFEDNSYNELEKAKAVAQHLGIRHFWETVSLDRWALLPQIVAAADEPFADTSMIPMYALAAMTRKNVTVCLSGDGGDELFAGYETYRADRLHEIFRYLPFKKGLAHMIQALPVQRNKVSLDYKLKQFVKGLSLSPQQAHYSWRNIFLEREKKDLVQPAYASEVCGHDPFDIFQKLYNDVKECNPMEQHLYVDLKTWLVDDILVKVDRMSMAHGLEVRAPFLNHRLAEWIIRCPTKFKINGLKTKFLFKKSQEQILPASVIHAKKEGFNAPISEWMTSKTLDQIIEQPTMRVLFHTDKIIDLWRAHQDHKVDGSLKLFGLLCLSLWLDQFTNFNRS